MYISHEPLECLDIAHQQPIRVLAHCPLTLKDHCLIVISSPALSLYSDAAVGLRNDVGGRVGNNMVLGPDVTDDLTDSAWDAAVELLPVDECVETEEEYDLWMYVDHGQWGLESGDGRPGEPDSDADLARGEDVRKCSDMLWVYVILLNGHWMNGIMRDLSQIMQRCCTIAHGWKWSCTQRSRRASRVIYYRHERVESTIMSNVLNNDIHKTSQYIECAHSQTAKTTWQCKIHINAELLHRACQIESTKRRLNCAHQYRSWIVPLVRFPENIRKNVSHDLPMIHRILLLPKRQRIISICQRVFWYLILWDALSNFVDVNFVPVETWEHVSAKRRAEEFCFSWFTKLDWFGWRRTEEYLS